MLVLDETDILNPSSPTAPLVDAYISLGLLLSDGGDDLDHRVIVKDVRANLERTFLRMEILKNEEAYPHHT